MMMMMMKGRRYPHLLLLTTDVTYKQLKLSHCALVALGSLAEDACNIQVQRDVLFAALLPVCLLTAWYQQNLNFHPHNTNFEVTTPVCTWAYLFLHMQPLLRKRVRRCKLRQTKMFFTYVHWDKWNRIWFSTGNHTYCTCILIILLNDKISCLVDAQVVDGRRGEEVLSLALPAPDIHNRFIMCLTVFIEEPKTKCYIVASSCHSNREAWSFGVSCIRLARIIPEQELFQANQNWNSVTTVQRFAMAKPKAVFQSHTGQFPPSLARETAEFSAAVLVWTKGKLLVPVELWSCAAVVS